MPKDIITFPTGTIIYHVTPKNTEHMREEREYLRTLPKTAKWSIKLDAPMYFGFSEDFTRYYDRKDPDWWQIHLALTTSKPIKLKIIYDKDIGKEARKKAIQGFDGWIANDVLGGIEPWMEIYLKKPCECIGTIYELDHSGLEQIRKYKASGIELDLLKKFIKKGYVRSSVLEE